MYVIEAVNVNDAYAEALRFLCRNGKLQNSRAGDVLALDRPATLCYQKPTERVLFDPGRDANPFFAIFESLWLLAGRNDARWLDKFVGDFSSRFAEEEGTLHGSYGFRWRNHFDVEGGGNPFLPDQLETTVQLLRANPADRRVVIQMWDAAADLGATKKDVPCNLMILPRIQEGELDLTVFNRSNDLVWGALGANYVQFSILQEYLAGRIGVKVGRQYQCTNNLHIYTKLLEKLPVPAHTPRYPETTPIGTNWGDWDDDLHTFMEWTDVGGVLPAFVNGWFAHTALPLYVAHSMWKAGKRQDAYGYLCSTEVAADWKIAATEWMARRLAKARNT